MDDSFEEGGWNFAHLALSHFASLFPSWQKRDGVLLPGDYFAFISCGVGPTVETFFW